MTRSDLKIMRRSSATDGRATLQQNNAHSNGFTLLEVILTVVLASALLSGLWALSGIYMRMFESGQDQVEQAQLLRALTQQIDDDLQAVAPGRAMRRGPLPFAFSSEALSQPGAFNTPGGTNPPGETGGAENPAPNSGGTENLAGAGTPPPGTGPAGDEDSEPEPAMTPPPATEANPFPTPSMHPTSSRSRLPAFALKGTETSLELTLLRLIPLEEQPQEPLNQDALINQNGPPKAPEWRVVKYRFTSPPAELEPEPDAATKEKKESEPGLAREDQSWEEFRKAKLAKAMTNATMTEEEIESEETMTSSEENAAEEPRENPTGEKKTEENEEVRMNIPQIVAARFQYFDGQTWLSDWDSTTMRSLPQAIEMTLQIKPTLAGQREDRRNEDKKTMPTETAEENEVYHDPGLEKKGNWPVYRQVWMLPGGVDQTMGGRRFLSQASPSEASPNEESNPSERKETP